MAVGYLPLHDTYALFGEEKKLKYLNKLIEEGFIEEEET